MSYSCIVVEDDPGFAKLLGKYVSKNSELELLGVFSDTMSSAMQILRSKPDILFLDINITGLDGPEMLKLVDYSPQTIVISSHPPEVMSDYDIEYTAFIQKPLKNTGQLDDAIRQCIQLIENNKK